MIKKKRGMVDIRELYKSGRIKIPKSDGKIEHNSEGFVEIDSSGDVKQPSLSVNSINKKQSNILRSSTSKQISSLTNDAQKTQDSSPGIFSFFDSGNSASAQTFSTEIGGYSKREVDTKIESLDNKIYRLEQRIELLERKAGINNW